MNSLILRVASRFLVYLMLAFSVFILLRGHNHPGGGFIAGLIAGSALGLYTMANGTEAVLKFIRLPVMMYLATGLTMSVVSALLSVIFTGQFFKGLWLESSWLTIGTPMLFDAGVFVTVTSAVLSMIFVLESKSKSH